MAVKLTKKELKALTDELSRIGVKWTTIYLFGSTAKGHADKDSDRDFCVIVPDATTNVDRLWVKLNASLGTKGYNFDVLLAKEGDFAKSTISPIFHEIKSTGIKVA
jgi:predicted nucleotidyltransferase